MDKEIIFAFLITGIGSIQIVFAECPPSVHPDIKGFGSGCRYRCNCKDNNQCDATTGECPNGCLFGWMGPACQYRNHAVTSAVKVIQNFRTHIPDDFATQAVDGDVTTCSRTGQGPQRGSSTQRWWMAKFASAFYIIGLIIKIPQQDKETFKGFSVEIGNNTKNNKVCYKHASNVSGETMMTVNCMEPIVGKIVKIKLAKNIEEQLVLCEVEIFGGRLVSFNKQTSARTILEYPKSSFWNSSYAVDGRQMLGYENQNTKRLRTCWASESTSSKTLKWWAVSLGKEFDIQGISFFSRLDHNGEQFRSYKIKVDGTTIFTDDPQSDVLAYNPKSANYTTPVSGSVVRVERNNKILVICEVEVFGECLLGKCGWECNTNCMCRSQTTGHPKIQGFCPLGCSGRWSGQNGKCDIECPDTKWGPTCDNICGQCKNDDTCSASDGTCPYYCKPGWIPPLCAQECNDGYFGEDCRDTCGNCKSGTVCNKVNGVCVSGCEPGYKIPMCIDECDPGWYGNNCSQECGKCRNGDICDYVTGNCKDGCDAGYQHQNCKSSCDEGYFGKECNHACGYCLDGANCLNVNGTCSGGCVAGYYGVLCKSECNDGYFGEDCRATCGNCKSGTVCNKVSGACAPGCEPGYKLPMCIDECDPGLYGDNCRQECGKCRNGDICDHVTGNCRNGCDAGYQHQNCKSSCDEGYFGKECNQACGYCLDGANCLNVDGACSGGCAAGYYGVLCKSECNDGYFGEDCRATCGNCKSGTVCNKVSGACAPGCEPGYKLPMCIDECDPGLYGDNCSQECGKCRNGDICDHVTGNCHNGCDAGYQHQNCKSSCDEGYFGKECNQACGYCLDGANCLNVDGACSGGCAAGYYGVLCKSECNDGYFGEDCRATCGNCKSGTVCNKVSGACAPGCEPGYKLPMCIDECDPGLYGDNCSQECGKCRNGDICDHVTGNCHNGCDAGYQHQNCKSSCDEGYFGKECNQACGYCLDGANCLNVDGACSGGCAAGYYGVLCKSACDVGYFGNECNQTCGYCLDGANCLHVDGSCSGGCAAGYYGLLCKSVSDPVSGKGPAIDIIVGVVTGVLLIGLVSFVCIFVYKRKWNSRGKTKSDENGLTTFSNQNMAVTCESVQNNVPVPKLDQDPVYSNTESKDYPGGNFIKISHLRAYSNRAKRYPKFMYSEFKELPYGLTNDASEAQAAEYRPKNRYKDLYPYNINRVILPETAGKSASTYINASYINGYDTARKYIAAQGALETTVEDIWRMVWSEQISIIVMLTNCFELGKLKCVQYWPDEGSRVYADVCTDVVMVEEYTDFKIRTFHCTKTESDERRTVLQFHYTAWPDKDVPDTALSLVQFWRKVRSHAKAKRLPWMVHCSAGVGRTGTFIALDYLHDQGKSEKSVNIKEGVYTLRQQRLNMVQTKEQYVYLHEAVAETLDPIGNVCVKEKFASMYRKLFTEEGIPKPALHDEFDYICDDTDGSAEAVEAVYLNTTDTDNTGQKQHLDGVLQINICKSRDPKIIPENLHRPRLGMAVRGRNDFINAVFVPTYRQKDRMILTQFPLKETVIDFVRMVWEFNISKIVLLEDSVIEEGVYWAESEVPRAIGPMKAELVSEKNDEFYTSRTVRYSFLKNGSEQHKDVEIFHFRAWSSHDKIPESTRSMLRLISDIENADKGTDSGPLVIQCMDGAKKSGLLCVLCCVLERIKTDGEVAIAETVRLVRLRRKQVIDNFEQYQYCYNIVREYIESHDLYANVM